MVDRGHGRWHVVQRPSSPARYVARGHSVSRMTDREQQNTHGVPDENADADTASGGVPEEPDATGDHHKSVDNSSGA